MYLARTGGGGGGGGCQINHEKAMTYYQLAAVQGHTEALFHLGKEEGGRRRGGGREGGEGRGGGEREGGRLSNQSREGDDVLPTGCSTQGHAEALFHLGRKREGEGGRRRGGGREGEGGEGERGREAVKSITRGR